VHIGRESATDIRGHVPTCPGHDICVSYLKKIGHALKGHFHRSPLPLIINHINYSSTVNYSPTNVYPPISFPDPCLHPQLPAVRSLYKAGITPVRWFVTIMLYVLIFSTCLRLAIHLGDFKRKLSWFSCCWIIEFYIGISTFLLVSVTGNNPHFELV
jgi:hypothetical protein